MSGLSLRARVLAGMALVALTLAVVGVVLTATIRSHLVEQVDARLLAAGGMQRGPGEDDPGRPPPEQQPFGERLSDVYEGVLHPDGRLDTVFAPNFGDDRAVPEIDLEEASSAAASRRPFTTGSTPSGGPDFRAHVNGGAGGSYWVTAIALTSVDDTIARLVRVEIAAGAVVLAVLAAVTWWVVRLGIRPVKQMTRTAEQIAAGDMSQRVPAMSPSTEAGQLGIALNHMLERLDAAFSERRRSQERLQRFVADASHELRTPVTTIRGYAELYRVGGLEERTELDEAMRRTEQEAVRMARLVDDLLSLAKLDQGRPLERRPVDLAQLAADAARDASAVDPERPITTRFEGPAIVTGDEDRLRQVIANVVGNAVVHTAPTTAVQISVAGDDTSARLVVADHGEGMTPDVAAQVTERFYRADPGRSRDRGGSGLGLSIAEAAVAAHGGSIAVDSVVGEGTTVTITLPAFTGNSQVGPGGS